MREFYEEAASNSKLDLCNVEIVEAVKSIDFILFIGLINPRTIGFLQLGEKESTTSPEVGDVGQNNYIFPQTPTSTIPSPGEGHAWFDLNFFQQYMNGFVTAYDKNEFIKSVVPNYTYGTKEGSDYSKVQTAALLAGISNRIAVFANGLVNPETGNKL